MSLGGLDGFGSFNGKATIKRKGAGTSKQNKAYYDQLEREAEHKEAIEEQKKLIEEAKMLRSQNSESVINNN